jgi:hypothetical protein
MNKSNSIFTILLFIIFSFITNAQDTLFHKLKIDTTYCNLNFYSNKTAQQFQKLFNSFRQK